MQLVYDRTKSDFVLLNEIGANFNRSRSAQNGGNVLVTEGFVSFSMH